MTISELLEGLKGVNPETCEALRNYPIYCCSDDEYITVNLLTSRNHFLIADVLQGCIQRAIEQLGWDLRQDQWAVNLDSTDEVYYYSAIVTGISETNRSPEYEGRGKSQAETLWAAYVATVKAANR